jgi:hypothetical protein
MRIPLEITTVPEFRTMAEQIVASVPSQHLRAGISDPLDCVEALTRSGYSFNSSLRNETRKVVYWLCDGSAAPELAVIFSFRGRRFFHKGYVGVLAMPAHEIWMVSLDGESTAFHLDGRQTGTMNCKKGGKWGISTIIEVTGSPSLSLQISLPHTGKPTPNIRGKYGKLIDQSGRVFPFIIDASAIGFRPAKVAWKALPDTLGKLIRGEYYSITPVPGALPLFPEDAGQFVASLPQPDRATVLAAVVLTSSSYLSTSDS